MRKIFIAVSCILFTHTIQSQSFDYIDEKVKEYPEFYRTKKLAKQINSDFSTELEKARAIYYWITHNIAYDYSATRMVMKKVRKKYHYKKSKTRQEVEQEKIVADFTIRKRIAVCSGYSMLFKQLCDLTNVHSQVVSGASKNEYARIESAFGGVGHAWNAIIIDGEWYLVDATWGAGGYSTELRKFIPQFTNVYFMTNPELFFLNHYPKDTKWLLMEKSKIQFSDLPLFFARYLELGINIKTPEKGVVESLAGEEISFEIEIPEELLFYRFTYAYNKDKYATRMKFNVKDTVGIATIPAPEEYPSYLTIYYNNESVASFKVKKKKEIRAMHAN